MSSIDAVESDAETPNGDSDAGEPKPASAVPAAVAELRAARRSLAAVMAKAARHIERDQVLAALDIRELWDGVASRESSHERR